MDKALKNHSMLAEERLGYSWKRIANSFRKGRGRAPIGHAYSIMVEALRIERPDINQLIKELNDEMCRHDDGSFYINDPTEKFNIVTLRYFASHLCKFIEKKSEGTDVKYLGP